MDKSNSVKTNGLKKRLTSTPKNSTGPFHQIVLFETVATSLPVIGIALIKDMTKIRVF